MGPVASPAASSYRPDHGRNDGFSFIELIVAMSILVVGLLGLAQVFYFGMAIVGTSSAQLIAREKAREAIESVHTARDTRVDHAGRRSATSALRRTASARPMRRPATAAVPSSTGEQPLLAAGPDGLVATADDTGQERTPGPDKHAGHRRRHPASLVSPAQIDICDIIGNPNLRQITVTIRYHGSSAVGSLRRTYTLTTYISSFS